ncbi:hypothetical protein LCGC14_2974600, partial [marine sediment metagenome]
MRRVVGGAFGAGLTRPISGVF